MSLTLLSVAGAMSTNIVTIEAGQTVLDAAVKMKENNIGSLVVVNGSGTAGLITDRDIVFKVVTEKINPADAALTEFLNNSMEEIAPDESIFEARQLMLDKEVDYLLVLEGGELKGIVSKHDLLKE